MRPQFPEWFYDEVQVQSFVLASGQAERRRHSRHERGLGRALDLAVALPGAPGLGSARLYQRRVRCLSHARPTGRERSGPDRVGQQGRYPHDRGVRPRVAREPHDPGHRQGP